MAAKKDLKYRESWHVDDKVILPDYAYKSITTTHTKRYHNCLYLLAGLNSCARNLMDYIAEQMDGDNVFYSNAYFRDSFKNFIKDNAKYESKTGGEAVIVALEYSDSSVKKALVVLSESGLIRPINKGVFRVNPEYFWKTEDKDRDGAITIELEFKAKCNTKLRVLQEETGITKVIEQ